MNTMKTIAINGIDYPMMGRGWCACGEDEVRKFLSRGGAMRFCAPVVVRNDYDGCNYRIDYRKGDDIRCAYVAECGEQAYVMTAPCPIPALEALGSRAYQALVGGDKDAVDNRPQPMAAGVWAEGHALADREEEREECDDDDTWDFGDFFGPEVKPQIKVWEPSFKTISRLAGFVCAQVAERTGCKIFANPESFLDDNPLELICAAKDVAEADETLRAVAKVVAGDWRAHDMGDPVAVETVPDCLRREVPEGAALRKIAIEFVL